MNFNIPDLGIIDDSSGFRNLSSTTDGRFISGESGVKHIVCTGDGKVEFVLRETGEKELIALEDIEARVREEFKKKNVRL
mgnify:CR=1 FL=1